MTGEFSVEGRVLTTERLFLRPFREEDLPEFHALMPDPEASARIGREASAAEEESVSLFRRVMEEKDTYAVTLQGRVIGSAGIKKCGAGACPEAAGLRAGELVFVLAKEYRGRGFMAEALSELIRAAFEDFHLEALFAGHCADDLPAERMLSKLGFLYRGTGSLRLPGTQREVKEYILTGEEYRKLPPEVPGAVTLSPAGLKPCVMYRKDVVYSEYGDKKLHLQLLRPIGAFVQPLAPLPCIVYVPGSAWAPQNIYGELPNLAVYAEAGYVLAVVEYRDFTCAVFPAPVADARNAVRFLRKNADQYGVDPEKIVLAGTSSGGHTAMYAGLFHDDDRDTNQFPGVSGEVKGLINFYGSTDFTFPNSNPTTLNHNRADSPEGMEMGGVDLNEKPELIDRLTVASNIFPETEIAPSLILHGTADFIVNRECSIRLYRRLRECGKDTGLVLVRGAGHGGPEFYMPAVVNTVLDFLRRVLA